MARRPARPVPNFPEAVRELLEDAKRADLTFEDAWSRALELVKPDEPGWGPNRHDCAPAGTTETPMQFTRRVMRAAYEA